MNQTKTRVRAMNQVWTKVSQKRAQTTRILTNISGGDSSYSSINGNSARILSTSAAVVVTAASMIENETLCDDSSFPEEILQHDTYNGVTIYLEKLSENKSIDELKIALEKSLTQWKNEGKRGIWIHIPSNYSAIVPICTELGFDFQHAKNGLLVMTQWLPTETSSRLPHGPTHQVGIGAVILHPETHEMLVVQEKTGPAAKRKLWKMPTGLTDPGEDIVEAAIREAKEETGLDVEFDRIICMRQAHGGIFNQSDMFFVVLLHLAPKYKSGLKNGEDVPLIPQEEEIAEIKWMPMEEFAAQDLWQGSPLYEEMNGAMIRVANSVMHEAAKKEGKEHANCSSEDEQCGLVAKNLPIGWRPGSQTIYVSRL